MELKNKLSNIHSRGTTERQREDSNNEFESDGDVRKNNSRSGFDKRRFQEAKQEQQKIMLLTM